MHSGHSGGQSANAKLTPPGTWQTVPNQRFASGAGAVPSYPDGFSLLPQQPLCAPNRSLLQVRDRRSQGLPCSRSWLSASLGRGSAASRRLPDPIGHCGPTKDPGLEGNLSDGGNSNEACANDLGYWTVMFMTKGGDRVGHSRVMAPRGKGPLTFEEVVGVIVEHASLLNLTVAYITYLGRDASIYTLLTPRTVQKRMDSFCVVVESKEDNPDLPSTRRQGKGTGVSGGELVVAEDCNEMQGLVGMATTANIMDEYRRSPRPTLPLKSGTPGGGLFRNVPSLTGLWQQQRHWSGLRTQSEKAREMQESWEMALTLLGKEEEGERKAIALDESSSWITLKVVEDRHAKALRKAERLRSHVIPLEPSRPYSATPKVWGGEGDEKKKDTRTEDKLQQPERAASVAAQKSLLCGVICGYKWRALPSEVRPQIKEAVAQDIACRLDVPRANITTDEYYGDSLIVQTAVEHDGTRTDAELQRSIATNDPTVNKTVQHKQSEDGFESKSQAKPCEKANLGPELDVDSILAPPTKDKQIATEPPPEPQKLHDLEQYNMKAKNEMTPTESARNYLRNRLNSLKDTMRRLEKEDGTHMLMALRRLEATTNKRNRDTKRKHLGNLYERTPKHADQTSTGNTMEEAPPQPLKHERQTTLNKITDEEPTEPAEDAEKAAPPLHSTEDIVPADTERELSEPAEDAEEEAAPPLHSTEDIVPADTERELSEPAEDAEKEAAPPLHSTEDIVPGGHGEGAE
ncbi:microtubule-associated protein Gb4 [Trypanosoma cruzi]|nr:microtubule-associated protein Gb4 [Trypanosoma cruzi]